MTTPPAAERYTHGHADSVLRSHRWRTAENSCAYLLGHLTGNERLLDVGCGPGNVSADLAERLPTGEVVALDNAPAALAAARAEAAGRNQANLRVEAGDVYALPFPDDTFDVVHAHQVLQHLVDPPAALGDMARVCRPGGLVAVRDGDYPAMTWYPAVPGLDDWMACYLAVARNNGAEPAAGRRLVHWARAAGLEVEVASGSAWCYATADERAFWGGLWAERITATALADQALAAGIATRPELEAMADAWRAWAAEPDGVFLVLHGEVLCRV